MNVIHFVVEIDDDNAGRGVILFTCDYCASHDSRCNEPTEPRLSIQHAPLLLLPLGHQDYLSVELQRKLFLLRSVRQTVP